MDARYAEDYEGRLREAIQEMRAENDAVVHAVKEEAEEYIAKKVRLAHHKGVLLALCRRILLRHLGTNDLDDAKLKKNTGMRKASTRVFRSTSLSVSN